MMTFEEFQATRQRADNAEAMESLIGGNVGLDDGVSGYVYHGGLHIFDMGKDKGGGGYLLAIANVETVSDDLAELEHQLYDWGVSEGVFD